MLKNDPLTELGRGLPDAQFITAPRELLCKLNGVSHPNTTHFREAKWIWPTAMVRGHILRSFTVEGEPQGACAEFICDNKFDLFVNGTEFHAKYDGGMYRIQERELPVVSGTNRLAMRLFQASDPKKFSAAVIGGIRIYVGDEQLTIVTDNKWTAWLVCNFYEQTEPEGWYLADTLRQKIGLVVKDMHPAVIHRSCIFKKSFFTKGDIGRAILRATAKGLYEPRLNGELFDTAMFIPGSMSGATEYQVFDVTKNLNIGENTLTFTLGNGWLTSASWGWIEGHQPSFTAQLDIEYKSGERDVIKTDESWFVAPSPITDNDLQFGERYDARLEEDLLIFENWFYAKKADVCASLRCQSYPPVRITERNKPRKIWRIGKDCIGYDFGTNAAGRAKITLRNTKRGDVIRIRYTEHIKKDGLPMTGQYQEVYFPDDDLPSHPSEFAMRNLDTYICRGDEVEEYYPRFAFTGFRYVYLEGYRGPHKEDTVERLVMHTDLKTDGDIETSNADIATIWDVVKRSYRGNIFTGPTDCPTREKNFWNGDISVFAAVACWYMDNRDFLGTWTNIGRKIQYGIYGWEDEEYFLPLMLYRFYGDRSVIETKYTTVLKLIEKRESEIPPEAILPNGNRAPYRDHKAVENVSREFFAGLFFTYMYKCAAEMADILGKTEDKNLFLQKWEIARAEFNKTFYLPDKHDYNQGCQGGIVLPVAFGLADEDNVKELMKTLHGYAVKDDYRFTGGIFSANFMPALLCDFGYASDAWRIMMGKDEPSLLHMISTGATTTTENWYGHREYDDIRQYDSLNHYAFGASARWFFEYLGGIRPIGAGFSKIRLAPVFYRELGDIRVKYHSVMGDIISDITYEEAYDSFKWTFTVPNGILTYVSVPDKEGEMTYTGGTYTLTVKI